jgi:hypothetical protein
MRNIMTTKHTNASQQCFFTIEFELLSIVRNEEIYVVFYVPLFGGKIYFKLESYLQLIFLTHNIMAVWIVVRFAIMFSW